MQCCPLLGTVLLKQKQKHTFPQIKTKQKPQRLSQDPPLEQELSTASCEAAVPGSQAGRRTLLGMLMPTAYTRERGNAGRTRKEAANNCTVCKFPAQNKHLSARLVCPNSQGSFLDNFKECLRTASQLTGGISNQISLHRQPNASCTAQTPLLNPSCLPPLLRLLASQIKQKDKQIEQAAASPLIYLSLLFTLPVTQQQQGKYRMINVSCP